MNTFFDLVYHDDNENIYLSHKNTIYILTYYILRTRSANFLKNMLGYHYQAGLIRVVPELEILTILPDLTTNFVTVKKCGHTS